MEHNILILSQIFLDIVLLLSVLIIYNRIKRLDPQKIEETLFILEKNKQNIENIRGTIEILEKNLKEKEKLTKDLQNLIENLKKELKKTDTKEISISHNETLDRLSITSQNLTKGELDLIESLRKFKE